MFNLGWPGFLYGIFIKRYLRWMIIDQAACYKMPFLKGFNKPDKIHCYFLRRFYNDPLKNFISIQNGQHNATKRARYSTSIVF